MRGRASLLWPIVKAVSLLVLLSGLGSTNNAHSCVRKTADAGGERPADDFKLTDQDGQPFRLSRLRGRAVLLFFGYTHCPDACPTTMAKLATVYKMLGSDASQVVTIFVSVDPQRDTPGVLKQYLGYFHLNSIGLTGPKEEIDAVVKQYGARYEIEQSDSAAGYHVNHSTDLYLLDRKGQLAKSFKYNDRAQAIADDVRQVVRH